METHERYHPATYDAIHYNLSVSYIIACVYGLRCKPFFNRWCPYGTTEMAAMHVYEKAFTSRQFGVGQAEAIVLFLIVACISGIQVYLTKKKEVAA